MLGMITTGVLSIVAIPAIWQANATNSPKAGLGVLCILVCMVVTLVMAIDEIRKTRTV